MTGSARPDVLVIGAGVIGAATAFQLSQLGVGKVAVLDRGVAGSGMSSRSSALVRMHYTFPPEVDLAVRSDALFDAWPSLVGRPSCVRRTGFVRIVAPGEEDQLRRNVAMQRAHGARAEVVDADTLAGLAPGLATAGIECAAWEEHGGYGDGAIVAADLMAAAREHGARYQPHTPVRSLVRAGGRVTGVLTDSGVQHAGLVVLAAGVWTAPLAATAGLKLPIETELHHVAILAHQPGLGASVACIDSVTQTYFRPEAAGAMTLVGGFDGPRGVAPDAVPAQAGALDLAAMVGRAVRRVPSLAEAGIAHGVTGVYDMTPDARPLLGAAPGLDGLIIAAGFSGMGFKIAPAVGECLAHLLTSGAAAPVDLAPFRPGRFDDGQPIVAPFPYSDD
ncbi:MAG: NAD(P)/FAD-dependent oxidoreductase [Streptosporangiaceae bacterium]